VLKRFARADASGRRRFLERAGIRYCLATGPLQDGHQTITEVAGFESFTLTECNPNGRRVFVTDAVQIEPDERVRLARLFSAELPVSVVQVDAPPPPPAGTPGVAAVASAAIEHDTPQRVVIRATAGEGGGQLVLLDSFDAGWHATVDGDPATIQRANLLFRAVRIAAGEHRIEFVYRPTTLYAGAIITTVAMLGLTMPLLVQRRRRQPGYVRALSPASGFTLIELMIVVAIIAIIAAIAIPGLLRSRQAANESYAIAAIRSIHTGQINYASTCGGGGYAQSISDLGTPSATTPFLAPEIALGSHSGYRFEVVARAGATTVFDADDTCNGSQNDSVTDYHASAVPLSFGSTGQRSFAGDVRGTIFQDMSGGAIANPIPSGATPVQ
jgi:prepilin-type N-terminal cleavage/methylation domain-containing protein